MRYLVVIEHGPDSWGAHVPDLPGCVAVAETKNAVIDLITEAVDMHIEELQRTGLPVPVPISEGAFVEVSAA